LQLVRHCGPRLLHPDQASRLASTCNMLQLPHDRRCDLDSTAYLIVDARIPSEVPCLVALSAARFSLDVIRRGKQPSEAQYASLPTRLKKIYRGVRLCAAIAERSSEEPPLCDARVTGHSRGRPGTHFGVGACNDDIADTGQRGLRRRQMVTS
jgi:hypothetical protein